MQTNYEMKQRAFDKKWIVSRYMIDPNETNLEQYEGKEMIIPKRWVVVGVYDWIIDIFDAI